MLRRAGGRRSTAGARSRYGAATGNTTKTSNAIPFTATIALRARR
ncbi:hypothetical protein SAMN05661080_02031 [Modestobacter sp. DSM 44400]|nr:hypothetical protein SAMN05661080_02031 [Modestobacter sp. DSM 44400]